MDSPFGKTLLPQMPPELQTGEYKPASKPWALIVILIVIILFSFFWFYEYKRIDTLNDTHTAVQIMSPNSEPSNPPIKTVEPAPENDIATLQNIVINTSVPDYSSLF